jgi:hypothetical protein
MRGSNDEQFYYSWLVAFLYVMSLGLGALFFVLIQFATKSGWGIVVRRLAENTAASLAVMFLAFIPVYMGLNKLYHHWTDTAHLDAILQGKTWYLNTNRFLIFGLAYFAIWSLLALWFRSGSVKQDTTGDHELTRSRVKWAGPGLIVFALTSTFASFDWAMSLEPHWYSTIFGVYYFAGSLVCVFAFLSLVVMGLRRAGCLEGFVTAEHMHDLGKLLFAFVVFWAYIGFSQFFLIWYANIPEETVWYLARMTGTWKPITLFLAAGHFIVPFFFLMSRHAKRKSLPLALGSFWMLGMHLVDMHWLVMPTLHKDGVSPHLLDFTTLLGVGGLFLAAFGFFLTRAKLVPAKDPLFVGAFKTGRFRIFLRAAPGVLSRPCLAPGALLMFDLLCSKDPYSTGFDPPRG